MSDAEFRAAIKQVITATKRKATRMRTDKGAHPSTAGQRAMREEAKGFRAITELASGKG